MSRFRQRIVSNNNIRDDNYLNFTAVSDQPVIIQRGGENTETVYYTLDNPELDNWIEFDNNSNITLNQYSIIYFKGNIGEQDEIDRANEYMQFLLSGGDVEAHGDIMSIAYNNILIKDNQFKRLFAECTNLLTAPELTEEYLTKECYREMFSGCSSLIKAPELNSAFVSIGSYAEMFKDCISLTETPNLLSTDISFFSYYGMFQNCTSLIKISSNLPSKNVPFYAYYRMFKGCSSLKDVDIIINATSISEHGCESMFEECVNLTNITENFILAQQIGEYCYSKMFAKCYELTTTIQLPATVLSEGCYSEMFSECYSIKKAPYLPAAILTEFCYNKMFYNCSKLNYVEVDFMSIINNNCVEDWLKGVSYNGIFVRNYNIQYDYTSIIPSTWNSKQKDASYENQYLTFVLGRHDEYYQNGAPTFYENQNEYYIMQFSFSKNGLEYSIDNGNTWISLQANERTRFIEVTNDIPKILWRGNLTPSENDGIGTFEIYSGENPLTQCVYDVQGNIMSILYGDSFYDKYDLSGKDYAFKKLFYNNKGLLNAENLILPATTLSKECYAKMFYKSSIEKSPELNSNVLSESCYQEMFYETFFIQQCKINARTLSKNCCKRMFYNSNLKNITLLAEWLVEGCYEEMFFSCNNLSKIEALFVNTPTDEYTKNWVYGVNKIGTFIKNTRANWNVVGYNGIPITWNENYNVYLTFTALEDSTFKFSGNNINYSIDEGNTWVLLNNGESTPIVNAGNNILWKGQLNTISSNGIGTFSSTGRFNAKGNAMSLLYGDNFTTFTSLKYDFVFYRLFYNCTKLQNSCDLFLPSNDLYIGCYSEMFRDCSELINIPSLYASNLNKSCYKGMFQNCTSLVQISIQLPATILYESCYQEMFSGCTKLENIPEIDWNNLTTSDYCFSSMFKDCTSLSELNSKFINNTSRGCCYRMFQNCTELNNIGDSFKLESIVASPECYYQMFENCTNLQNSPEILCEKIGENSCKEMFKNCINLRISCKQLYPTELKESCYEGMFNGCKLIEVPPELSATNLARKCCKEMFKNCESLKQSPSLTSEVLQLSCYEEMFYGCKSLTQITTLLSDNSINNNYFTKDWVKGVNSNGTFISKSIIDIYGNNGIPLNWVNNLMNDKLILKAYSDGDVVIYSNVPDKLFWYNKNNSQWIQFSSTIINVNRGDVIYFKGNDVPCSNGIQYTSFSGGSAQFEILGNIMALVDNRTDMEDYMFDGLFFHTQTLVNAEHLELPSLNISRYCYKDMFNQCTNLQRAPKILPALELEEGCYQRMFYDTFIHESPILPSETLVDKCYESMFAGCSKLKEVTALFLEWDQNCTNDWFAGVRTNGTFTKDPRLINKFGSNYIPQGWNVSRNNYNNDDNHLCFKFETEGYIRINFTGESSDDSEINSWNINDDEKSSMTFIEWSSDRGITWNDVQSTTNTDISSEIWIRGGGNALYTEIHADDNSWWKEYYITFNPSSNCSVSGNILELFGYIKRNRSYDSVVQYITFSHEGQVAHMFDGAQYLISASDLILPPDNMSNAACMDMFKNCISLTDPPKLSTLNLHLGCYARMFYGCTSLEKAPELPALQLKPTCYYEMFCGCSQLNYIKAMFITTPSTSPYISNTVNWVEGVSPTGTFVKNSVATWDTIGNNGVPNGWTIETANS